MELIGSTNEAFETIEMTTVIPRITQGIIMILVLIPYLNPSFSIIFVQLTVNCCMFSTVHNVGYRIQVPRSIGRKDQ